MFAEIADFLFEGAYMLDRERHITLWNRAAERITGYSAEEAVGKQCMDNLLRHVDATGCELCLGGCPVSATLNDGKPREAAVYLHHKDGHRVQVTVKVIPLVDESGKTTGAIEIFVDRSDRSELLREIESLRKESLIDHLTGLGNRRFAEISLDSSMQILTRSNLGFGVLMLDIDHFKRINDTYGHPVGDRFLRMVAWTLANAVRRMDTPARWGGEEFVVIAPGVSPQVLAEIAERIRALVERSWITFDSTQKITATVSIGGAVARQGDTIEKLIERADSRLYACKDAGRNRVEVGD